MTTRAWQIVAGVATVAVILALTLVIRSDSGENEPRSTPRSTTTTSTTASTTTSTSTTTTAPSGSVDAALWPVPGSGTRYTTPADAARSFATEFLRFERPELEAFRAGDARSGEVPLRPRAGGPVTTVLVRQVSGADWSVIGATTKNIEATTPAPGDVISSPVRVAGRAHAFEGNVEVEVRADGRTAPLGKGFVTGGGDAMRPFEGSITFDSPATRLGAVVFFTTSAENGQIWEATVVRVAFR